MWPPPLRSPPLWPSVEAALLPSHLSVSRLSHPRPCAGSGHTSQHPGPPRCVHLAEVSGQSRVTATRARASAAGIRGLGDAPHTHTAFPSSPTPLHAEPSALQVTGIWACLCVRRSVRVSCGSGGHVRDRLGCRQGEYALVSSRFTKTAHPVCSPLQPPPSRSGLHGQSRAQIQPPLIHAAPQPTPQPRSMPAQKPYCFSLPASHSARHTVEAAA